MRRLLVAAVITASVGGAGAVPALAGCDPDGRPLCRTDCGMGTPNIKDPTNLSWLARMCPDA